MPKVLWLLNTSVFGWINWRTPCVCYLQGRQTLSVPACSEVVCQVGSTNTRWHIDVHYVKILCTHIKYEVKDLWMSIHGWDKVENADLSASYHEETHRQFFFPLWWLLVAYWLKHWTVDRKVQGSSPTSSIDLFLFWMHSALPQKLSKRFSFASFSQGTLSCRSWGTLKISLSANWGFSR